MDEQYYEYRTGRTEPKKKHNGIIAFLLICIIFLCGLVSALGLLNIRLSLQLHKSSQDNAPVSFAEGDQQLPAQCQEGLSAELEGMTVQELPALYQQIYDLPQGLYICHVADGSDAQALGILPGDVLTRLNGTAVSRLDALASLLSQQTGEPVEITVCRSGQQNRFTITIDD